MADPLQARALTDIYRPFPLDRNADQSLPPQGPCNPRMPVDEVQERVLLDLGELHGRDGANRVIHLPQHEGVDVEEIARQEERDDLPPPVLQLLVAAGPALQDQVDVPRRIALADDVLVRSNQTLPLTRDSLKGALILSPEACELLELADEVLRHAHLHGVLPQNTRFGSSMFTCLNARPNEGEAGASRGDKKKKKKKGPRMPRYFFHLRTAAGLEDDELGLEFPGLEAAYLDACRAIPEMAS